WRESAVSRPTFASSRAGAPLPSAARRSYKAPATRRSRRSSISTIRTAPCATCTAGRWSPLVRSLPRHGRTGGAENRAAPVLELRGLTKTYAVGRLGAQKTVRALSAVDLTLEKGKVLGLVGESGSGKTTLVRTVAYLERPTSGEIRVFGRALPTRPSQRRLRDHHRQVQMIFQDPYTSLDPLHKVRHSV